MYFTLDKYTFITISHSVLLRMRKVSDKNCRESRNTRFMFIKFLSKVMQFIR